MAAGTGYIDVYLSTGKKLNVLISTSAAVGTIPTLSFEGAATATSNTDFQVDKPSRITDIVCYVGTAGGVSAGECEIYNVTKAQRTGKFLPQNTTNWAATVANRSIPRVMFVPGFVYRLIQSTAQTSA